MSCKADIRSDDYYKVLGVDKGASEADLGRAYKKLALKHHPDKNPTRKEEAEEEFKKLTEAYDVLRDPEKRKNYDQFGRNGLGGGNPQAGETGYSFNGGGTNQANMSREDAEMIFRNMFGGQDPFASFFGDGDGIGTPFVFQSMGPGLGASGCGTSNFQFFSSGGSQQQPSQWMQSSSFPMDADFGGRTRSRRANSRPNRRPKPAHVIQSGTPVMLKGLSKSPEHNGKIGHIVGSNASNSRYDVQLTSSANQPALKLSLRPQNMTQLCNVKITGLSSKPELNGSSAEIFNYDEAKQRYMVLVNGAGIALSLQPSNCILNPGTCVIIQGLSKSECNGQRASIFSIDLEAGRYTVDCESGKRIRIKYENVLC